MTEEQIDETLRLPEPVVKAIAKKFSVPGLEYVDLLQVGRITVWRLAKERNILPENFNDFLGLIKIVIKRAFINEQIAAKRQKRKPLNEATSIDAPLDENTKFSLQQILAAPTAMDASETLERLKSIAFITRHPEAIKTTLWFLVEMLEIEHSDIPKKLNSCLFIKMKLARFLRIFFSNSPFQAINYAWPKEFLPQQMAKAPMRYWQGQRGKTRAIKALRWTLAQISDDISEYPFLLTEKFFHAYGLMRPLLIQFNWQRFDFLDASFPGQYHPWQMHCTPRGYFDTTNNRIKAIKWLTEEIFGFDINNLSQKDVWKLGIAQKITKKVLAENGLRELSSHYPSPEPLLRLAYPNKFMPWDFPNKTKWAGERGKKLAGEATRWVIEELCNTSPLSDRISYKFFCTNRLRGVLTSRKLGFNSSPKAVFKNAYPDLFK